ncbi:HDOD domain-containing protein [Christensenellaceae bacterium OttesenSCG-928-M15]|nr:HDOD domain-containing protein [Christensenellaceae bacterium OttesenSCG-928-M15]
MKTFIAAIPLFDSVMKVEAYYLCDKTSDRLLGTAHDFQAMGEALLTRGLDLVDEVGIDAFTGGMPLFVELNQFQLLMDVPTNKNIEADKLVCVLPENIARDAAIVSKCENLKSRGYKLAQKMGKLEAGRDKLYSLMDFILVSYKNIGSPTWLRKMAYEKRAVVEEIPDAETYERLAVVPNTYFSGTFYSRPITKGATQISPLKINALQLLKQVNEIDSDLTQIARIIERDPAISISLLRFINSPAVRVSRKIESIPSAVAILGQKEMKRWVTVAVSVSLAEDRPSEITKLSLVRAKFAENLATAYEMGALAPSLFMAGLFSLLDVILEKPMEEAIKEVAVDERVKRTLVDKTGDLYEVLDLIYAYEKANWDMVSVNMIRNNVQTEAVTKAFIEALVWYKELLSGIDDVSA